MTVQIRLRDGTPVPRAGIPFHLAATDNARFAAGVMEGTLVSGGGTASVDVMTSPAGRVVINLTDPAAQSPHVSFQDNQSVGIDGQLYFSDFESGSGGFAPIQGTTWELGVPTSGPWYAVSGSRVWGTQLAGPLPRSETAIIESTTIPTVFTGATVYLRYTNFFDYGTSEYGTASVFVGPSHFVVAVAHGQSGGYRTEQIPLTFGTGEPIRLRFESTAPFDVSVHDGWYIDDVQLYLMGFNFVSVVFQ